MVNVSSILGTCTLNQCSTALQERFRSEDITEEELVGLMQQFVDETKQNKHKQGGWPETAYGVSKTGLTVTSSADATRVKSQIRQSDIKTVMCVCLQTLSMILARRLSKERPNDGVFIDHLIQYIHT